MKPGAVPIGFGRTSAPSGKSACFALFSAISRLKRLKNARICSSDSASRTSLRPNARAAISVVRSSRVGPSPPETSTTRARAAASRSTSSIARGSSGTLT
jgi:hypothetical protein